MKNSVVKKSAWTLAEMAIAFFVLSIIISISLSSLTQKVQDSNKKLYYSALNTVMKATGEIIAAGHTDASGNMVGDYYSNMVNIVNTVGATNNTSVNYTTPNFILTNGMQFYNMGGAVAYPTTIYVDINGKNGFGKDPTQNSHNPDILRINVYKNGFVEPYTTGNAFEGNLISTKITIWDATNQASANTCFTNNSLPTYSGSTYPYVLTKNATYNRAAGAKACIDAGGYATITLQYVSPKF